MKRSRRKKKYYGKGLIRPTLNSGRIFVGEGLRKKKKRNRKKKVIYGKGVPLYTALLAASALPTLLGFDKWKKIILWKNSILQKE